MLVDVHRPLDSEATAAIDAALESCYEPLGIDGVKIELDESHAGDPMIRLRLQHRLLDPHVPSEVFRSADRRVREAVWSAGERRFVYIEHKFDEDQDLATR